MRYHKTSLAKDLKDKMKINLSLSNTITYIIIILICNVVSAETIAVKDGDTIKIGMRNIRLYGIDAPESKQKCYYLNGNPWDCGLVAKQTLEELIGKKK